MHAEQFEINLHSEIFNNFHPIMISQGKVKGRPMVAWPVARVEMLSLPYLTSKSDSRRVNQTRVNHTSGPWLTTVDRVVVVDAVTDNFPAVMLVLENPFAEKFRDLGGQEFVPVRNELLKRLFSWPSDEVTFHSSLVSYDVKELEEITKWLEILGLKT